MRLANAIRTGLIGLAIYISGIALFAGFLFLVTRPLGDLLSLSLLGIAVFLACSFPGYFPQAK